MYHQVMSVYEMLTIVLIALLATGATIAIYVGLIGLVGGLYFVRCEQCDHLMFSATKRPEHSCAHCRHPVLMHPVHTMLHPRPLARRP
jgi:DNA-directed RNA polymerase subunit RPC12/RpoP